MSDGSDYRRCHRVGRFNCFDCYCIALVFECVRVVIIFGRARSGAMENIGGPTVMASLINMAAGAELGPFRFRAVV